MKNRDYSYTLDGNTLYMSNVIDYISKQIAGKRKILDIPAGSGLFAHELQKMGHDVTKADIHNEEGFVFSNMEAELPFEENEFDVVTCLEGVEHVINPVQFIKNIVRITSEKGVIVISTPNISNLHSRLQFLFTGTFFQFDARGMRQTNGRLVDRGHVSPFTPLHLVYIFGALGCELQEVRTDRAKRKILFPLYLLMKPISYFWTKKIARKVKLGTYPGVRDVYKFLTGLKLMFGRSQILIFNKGSGGIS